MSKSKDTVTVFPVDGHFLLGVAAIPQEVSSDEAEAMVASGAFSFTQPTEPAAEAEDKE